MLIKVLAVSLKEATDRKQIEVEYYKEVDPSTYDFYENLNEIDSIVRKEYPGYYAGAIAPTVSIRGDNPIADVFDNDIPIETITKEEAKKRGII